LRFPECTLEPQKQRYHRIARMLYQFTLVVGSFTADLRVNETGFVIKYPGLWSVAAA
jgi:hypothetical protein